MKKILFLLLLSLSVLTARSQSIESRFSYIESLPTAAYVREYNLSIGDTTGTFALRNANDYPFERKEFEWAIRNATLYSDEIQKYDDYFSYDNLRDGLNSFYSFAYQSAMVINLQALPMEHSDGENSAMEDYKGLRQNRLMQNPKFRKFAVGLAKRLIKEMVEFYPKDYKQSLLSQIDYAIEFMKDIPNHNYHVEQETNDYGYSWLEMYDGEEVAYQASQGLEGIILRRILLNEIPIKEMMDITQDIRKAVSEADNSDNPDVMMNLRLNEDFCYCVGCQEPYFVSYIPHEELVNDVKKLVYTKYEPFMLDMSDKMKGWGCNYDIFITAIDKYKETTYYHDQEGQIQYENYDMTLYRLLSPRYGFGHCFVENNITVLEMDGRFRIHRKLY